MGDHRRACSLAACTRRWSTWHQLAGWRGNVGLAGLWGSPRTARRSLRWALIVAVTQASGTPVIESRTSRPSGLSVPRGAKVARVAIARTLAEAIEHVRCRTARRAVIVATDRRSLCLLSARRPGGCPHIGSHEWGTRESLRSAHLRARPGSLRQFPGIRALLVQSAAVTCFAKSLSGRLAMNEIERAQSAGSTAPSPFVRV